MANSGEPHVLLFPFPAQGHIRPFLQLAELLSIAGGLRITFVDTEFNHSRILASSPAVIARLAARPLFRFLTIADGLSDDNPRSFLQFQDISWSLLEPKPQEDFKAAVAGGDGWPQVSCAIVDALAFAFVDSALDMGIPVMMVRTSSACSTLVYHYLPHLVESGEVPFPDGADLDVKIQSIPGMPCFLRRRDLPSFYRNAKSTDDPMFLFITRIISNNTKVGGLIFNTVECFDSPILSQLAAEDFPTAFAIGPFHTLLQEFNLSDGCDNKVSKSASLWEEDMSCISWLDTRPHKSVIYASFGSITVLSKEKLIEFWHGLAKSGYPFLWVMRKDILESKHDTTEQVIPTELIEITRKRGYIVEWAPQEEVLMHQAVGCFLTHSGWNSTLESIIAGVPMICWPFFADQQINSRYVSEVWKIGVDMKDICDRTIMEQLIREVMEGNKSVEIRISVEKMAEMARISVKKGGSSYENFKKLLEKIKLMSSEYSTKITQASDVL